MDSKIVGIEDCNEYDGFKQIELCRSSDRVDGDAKSSDAVDEYVLSLTSLPSKNKDVVLAFNSLQCNASEVVEGLPQCSDFFRVEDCFVADEVL
ncbi:hypothetical protein L6452_40320 [Arctium lappa]|uniref:Uncharacterized protein n=1 Tax=Arctium lappa TaxID=4217 RepID=A0ACB8XLL4_ARCLA|nr:hypothetical protein L6452_40320 [Arctium lappa]